MLFQYTCQKCFKAFENRKKDKKFCSSVCYFASKDNPVDKICERCSISFTVPYRGRAQRFCSGKCSGAASGLARREERENRSCLNCSKEFEVISTLPTKYCSTDCFYKHSYGRESKIVTLICEACHGEYEKPFIKRNRKFCSKSCAFSGERNPSNRPEVSKKVMETRRANIESGLKQPAWLGKTHTEESKQKISVARNAAVADGVPNGMLGKKHSEDSKEKMSKTKTQLIIDGKLNPLKTYHVTGFFVSEKTGKRSFYRSSWERDVMRWLDKNDEVLTWEHESVRVEYYYDNHKRWYVPDFIVHYRDRKVMYEVKPVELVGFEKTKLKETAAREWCSENGIDSFEYLTKQILLERGIL